MIIMIIMIIVINNNNNDNHNNHKKNLDAPAQGLAGQGRPVPREAALPPGWELAAPQREGSEAWEGRRADADPAPAGAGQPPAGGLRLEADRRHLLCHWVRSHVCDNMEGRERRGEHAQQARPSHQHLRGAANSKGSRHRGHGVPRGHGVSTSLILKGCGRRDMLGAFKRARRS